MTASIYKPLQLYFIGQILSIAGNLIVDSISALLSLAAIILQLYALSKLRLHSDRLRKAYRYTVIALIGSVATVLPMLLGVFLIDAYGRSGLLLLSLLVLLGFTVVSLIASFHFYWGLDELIPVFGYPFQGGLLHWCFYLPLIVLLSSLLALIAFYLVLGAALICGIIALAIFYQFIQVVKRQEGL